jgi:CHAD domain-containing protein
MNHGGRAAAHVPRLRAPALVPPARQRYAETVVEHSPERELKLAASTDFRMPSIFGLVGAVVRQAPPERNETTYYDTDDLRLARWGASLRHRPGEGWTVKLPAERDAPFLVRPEIVFEGNGDEPPAAAVDLVRGFVRSRALRGSIQMTTRRQRTELHDTDGSLIAGVVDDAVAIHNGPASRAGFRELEVEIGEEMTPSLLDALVERLRQAGAGAPDQTAKYIRALDRAEALRPEIAVADLGSDASAGDVVQRALALSVIRLIRHDAVVRLDLDLEGVHQARVATRRLRSDLRTFHPLVDRKWSTALRAELGWIAGILGDVRDGDVLLVRLRQRAGELPAGLVEPAGAAIETLEQARNSAFATLSEAFRSERYFHLLDRLVEAANAPRLRARAGEPAADAIPELVRRPWHKLEKRAKHAGGEPSDERLHEIRIRTKRVRYAADAATPIAGKPARALAHAAARLQDVLGDLNDARVAAGWLDEWAVRADGEAAYAAATLAERERAAASELRDSWRAAWEALAEPQLRAWM